MTSDQQTKIEAAAFRALIAHLQQRTDVQNIDLMNLAGFCRNCLSKWYSAAAKEQGLEIDYAEAQKTIYAMPIEEWKQNFQTDANEEQKKCFNETRDQHARISGY
tara:strand:- start:272 stop:586 length:315 start_codon:yes stop_codon:yes gene_type:complete